MANGSDAKPLLDESDKPIAEIRTKLIPAIDGVRRRFDRPLGRQPIRKLNDESAIVGGSYDHVGWAVGQSVADRAMELCNVSLYVYRRRAPMHGLRRNVVSW